MPRLLLFAVCEKSLTDSDDATTSLITLITALKVGIIAGAPIPNNAVVPIRLATTALWLKLPEDEGKQFESRVELIDPTGEVKIWGDLNFEIPKKSATTKMRFDNFPIAHEGTYQMRLSIREAGDTEWNTVTDYPVELERQEMDITPFIPDNQG